MEPITLTIITFEDEDGNERLRWMLMAGEAVLSTGSMFSSIDCPEDNSISRMGVADQLAQLAEALGVPAEVVGE